MDSKRPTPRNGLIKMAKVKDKESILRAATTRKQVASKENPIKLSADFLEATFWSECNQLTTYNTSSSNPFRIEGQIKSFTDKQKPKQFTTTKLALWEMLTGLL